MGRAQREQERFLKRKKRMRRLKLAKSCAALCLVVLAVWLGAALVSGLFSAGKERAKESAGSMASPASAVAAAAALLPQASVPEANGPQAGESSSEPAEASQLADPLLVLVNDETPLPEDWQVTLKAVNDEEEVDARMYDDLMAMFNAAGEEDVWFWVASGYRSVEDQETILEQGVQRREANGMTREAALEDALCTINRPGYSEHHTGLAVDLNDVSDGFEETEAYRWLCDHAAEYGFVQRYRADKADVTGIDNESWHYRYVGRENAQEMERLDMCLEEYVAYRKSQGNS